MRVAIPGYIAASASPTSQALEVMRLPHQTWSFNPHYSSVLFFAYVLLITFLLIFFSLRSFPPELYYKFLQGLD